MSYMSDPERKRLALERQMATRKALGPRLGRPKVEPRAATAPPSPGRTRSTSANGSQHPTRDEGTS